MGLGVPVEGCGCWEELESRTPGASGQGLQRNRTQDCVCTGMCAYVHNKDHSSKGYGDWKVLGSVVSQLETQESLLTGTFDKFQSKARWFKTPEDSIFQLMSKGQKRPTLSMKVAEFLSYVFCSDQVSN